MTRESYAKAYASGFDRTTRFLISHGLSGDYARDIAQAAWARGWERLNQLRHETMVFTWVNTIALNFYRRSIRNERAVQALPELSTTAGPDLAAIDLRRLLTFCRPCDRQLLEQQMHGATAEEMAKDLGISETAIRIRLLRARRAARNAAEKQRVHLANQMQRGKMLTALTHSSATAA
jgi:DNA-directed RNA polymerase specialized sigma24 family protein